MSAITESNNLRFDQDIHKLEELIGKTSRGVIRSKKDVRTIGKNENDGELILLIHRIGPNLVDLYRRINNFRYDLGCSLGKFDDRTRIP